MSALPAEGPTPAPADSRQPRFRREDPALSLGPAASRRVGQRDAELAVHGWRRRFIGAPPRLAEMIALYGSLGHEVRTEPLDDDDLAHECAGCALALSVFRVVYTRSPR